MDMKKYIGGIKRNWDKIVVTAAVIAGVAIIVKMFDKNQVSGQGTIQNQALEARLIEQETKLSEKETKLEEKDKSLKEITEKYTLTLEENKQLNVKNDKLIEDVNDLRGSVNDLSGEYAKLNKEKEKSLEELIVLNKKHTKIVEEYNSVLKQKEQLEGEQKKLASQIKDLTKKHEDLSEENIKLSKNYASAIEQGKELEQKLEEAGKKYTALDKQAIQLLDEKKKIEKDRVEMVEKYNKALEDYNQLLKGPTKESPKVEVKLDKYEDDLTLHQVRTFRATRGLEIVLLKPEAAGKETDVFERTSGYTDKQLRDKMVAGGSYGFLIDFNGDGVQDLVYEGDEKGKDELKLGRVDGTYAPAETISNKISREVFKKQILDGLGF